MNVKSDTYLIRALLYFCEIIQNHNISKTAEKNGIKPSNLSILIRNLEKQIGTPLLYRTSHGTMPTPMGQKLYEIVSQVRPILSNIEQYRQTLQLSPQPLNLYIASNLQLENYDKFALSNPDIILNFVNSESLADVSLLNHKPTNPNFSYTEVNIGNILTQKVWIVCHNEKPQSFCFFDFIIAALLS